MPISEKQKPSQKSLAYVSELHHVATLTARCMGSRVFPIGHIYTPSKIRVLLGRRGGWQCLSQCQKWNSHSGPASLLPQRNDFSKLTSYNNRRNKSSMLAAFYKQENEDLGGGVTGKNTTRALISLPQIQCIFCYANSSTPGWPPKPPEKHIQKDSFWGPSDSLR